ncbi:MAG: nitrate reductase subunit beta [Gammaproteobacteria bacterium]|nr:nitrate reductase subunit beta [Gammaproteobacteria bacterium]
MKVRAQFSLVFNLDKCIGCHTCSVTCKNVWTSRKGVEYAWFNNVESKPGIGFPKDWEDQELWRGGWELVGGKLQLKSGSKLERLLNIFANPDMPEIDDYYEPFTFNYAHLQNAPLSQAAPTARPISQIDGSSIEKISWGPNWEDGLAGEFAKRSQDSNFDTIEKDIYAKFENSFQVFLPRICNHCLNPSCVAACPSGSMYKREEDGIVLVDQDKCRGWRMCVSSCPYKKVFYNWESGKAEKCTACYPRFESGMPTACSESCVGRIRYNGIMLYDADRIAEYASTPNEQDLYEAQRKIFLDPHDPAVIAQAHLDGVTDDWIEAAQKSPIYKLVMDWKVAFPLHPEFRTLPMVWYVPPLSPVQSHIDQGNIANTAEGLFPSVDNLRTPLQYLANLLSAGQTEPIRKALNRMIAMRLYHRSIHVEGKEDKRALDAVGLSVAQAQDMYRYMAIANYEDRFVLPTNHPEISLDDFHAFQGQNGFTFGNDSSPGISASSLFPERRKSSVESLKPAPMAPEK